ncbi:excisionase and transcriptional regulator [Aeromonas phage LAh_7]|jgi:predicted DNA-binding transcriptional regulator AlpA|uniref:Putative AlpA family regulatory protein n=1 Tax=Aeromonas phage LAh_7 TaxID=2591031 RepID=A0A514A0A1_9CAUD|nr:excisionase and transcriptional regulator [Aeromonas phage LAh_7]MBX7020164.1 AlpA family phage regulatory protein [Providencia rettgeri]QDH46707.1 putative AlpA family regulatory protein [Aeromonas phage LAh_7]UHS65890.1 putative AlpA family regulatory protein [Aeromonas phage AhMtk13b]
MTSLDDELRERQLAARANRMRPQAVAELFRVSRMTIYSWLNDDNAGFPKPKRYNRRHIFWYESELREWAEQKGYDLTPLH